MLTCCLHSDKLSAWHRQYSVRTRGRLPACQAGNVLLFLRKKKLVALSYKRGRKEVNAPEMKLTCEDTDDSGRLDGAG